ncbi:hypothetical protein [Chryseobacterium sp. CH1]|uniref:hypothetical protein n=1 Tax=Chryseobacterium sp. CH1 TaxID=713551 RepID=UPI001E5B0FAE|nr:hypothetical protein [Chryseobacterium sp. CH1]
MVNGVNADFIKLTPVKQTEYSLYMEVTIAKPNGSSTMFSPINYLTTYRNDYNVTYNGKKW